MHNIKHIILTVIIFIFAQGCKKEANLSENIIGSWELVSVDGNSVPAELSVWLDFTADGFSIYQRAESEAMYERFEGTWSLIGTTLSGCYMDGTSWGSSYSAAVSGEELRLTSATSPQEVTLYTKSPLPSSVTDYIHWQL